MKPWYNYAINIADTKEAFRLISIALKNLMDLLNNNVTFSDNISCQVLKSVILVNGIELGIEHNLNRVPFGFLIKSQSASASVYNGTTEWNDRKIYLIASADVTVDIIVLGG